MVDPIEIIDTLTPMLATSARPADLQTLVGTHVFDPKLDGIRAIAGWWSEEFKMRNRTGRDITGTYPEMAQDATAIDGPLVLDGEIIATNGAFQDIAQRDAQKGRSGSTVHATFAAFDVLVHPTEGDVRHLPYAKRRLLLQDLPLSGCFQVTQCSPDPALFEQIKAAGGEGVIAKRLNARYASGRSKDWLKVKATHTVTALAAGYEPGSGSRAEMGAILLATLERGPDQYTVRTIGKAGSGFSQETARQMKAAIDAAANDLSAVPVVEIECLGATRGGVLRQPVFKGLRTDLTYADATFDQLAALPRS